MKSYKSLDQLALDLIRQYATIKKDNASMSSQYSSDILPYSANKDVSSDETSEIVKNLVENLNKLVQPYIDNGLEVIASNPPNEYINISSGAGVVYGHYIEIDESMKLRIPFDGLTSVFYVNFDGTQIMIEPQKYDNKLALAKVVIPKPGTTIAIEDDKPSDNDNLNGWIVSGKDVLFDGKWTFDDDSIAMLGNKLGYILANNIYGEINLSENLTIANTQGTMYADSKSLSFYYENAIKASEFNRNGTYFYDTSGFELAKFTNTEARVGNIVIYPNSIQSNDFVSGNLGSGFQIKDSGDAEFNNIRARGKISTSIFERDSVSSIGGNFLVCDSDILNLDMTALDSSTLTIIGDAVFAVSDIIRIRDGTHDEWLTVTDISNAPTYTVTRDNANIYTSNNNPIWKKGTCVVNYGNSGKGLIFMTASESNAPYLSILTHSGAPWNLTTTQLRLGNLNGFLGYVTNKYGIAIGTSNSYMKYDDINGLQIKGSITITGGNASVTFYQDSEPSSGMKNGDYWIDTNDNNKLYTYQNNAWIEITSGGNVTTFRQSSIPVALNSGDLWIDSDNSKLYRATNEGDDEIKAGEWELQDAAVATGWASTSDTTKIDGGYIYTNTVTADAINVTNLSAINADMGSITAGNITLDSSGYIKGGQTDYTSGGGFFLGYKTDAYKLSIGNSTNSLKWNGSSLVITGEINATSGTFTGEVNVGTSSNVIIDGDNKILKVFGDTLTITADVNDKLDWIENGSTKVATLTASTSYTPSTIASEVQTKMRATGDANTTCTYNTTTRYIAIANNTLSTLTLNWASGANALVSCGKVLGYNINTNDTGLLSYIADYQTALRVEIGELL